MTVSSDVTQALVARLNAIKVTAGYSFDMSRVYYPLGDGDYQQMAADLQPQNMPAVILYQGPVKPEPQHNLISMFATYYIELVREWVPDSDMWDMVAALGKSVFGGASDATENSGYRFHPAVVEPRIMDIIPDFGMLQGNRLWVVVLMVHYRVRYTNL